MIDQNKLNYFINDFEKLIKNEKENNPPILGKIISIKDSIIEVSIFKPSDINVGTSVEINKIQATIQKNNHKNLLIKLNRKSNFYVSQKIKINNIQNDIIILKLESLLSAIKDNKLNESNKQTLALVIDEYNNSYNKINVDVSSLNKNQSTALNKSISANKFHIIKGPPGTGKTHTIVEIIKKLYAGGNRILLTTHTHIAIDNILEKLDQLPDDEILRVGNRDKINPRLYRYHTDEKIKRHPLYKKIQALKINNAKLSRQINNTSTNVITSDENHIYDNHNKSASIFNRIISKFYHSSNNDYVINNSSSYERNIKIHESISKNNDLIDEIENLIINDVYDKSKIIASTVLSSSASLMKNIEFDYVIMDEASQVPTYLALLALLKTDKFILIGDDKQLQPITSKHYSFLTKSIFNYMIEKYPKDYTFLNIQYRMNPEISNIVSKLYYDNRLLSYIENIHKKLKLTYSSNILLDESPITFINTSNVDYYESNVNGGCCNRFEAQLILTIIDALIKNNVSPSEIGIITPYRKQKLYIHKQLTKKNMDIECDTIYRFQGREKDVIIISFCKSNPKNLTKFQKRFLSDENQLNVSITRSRKKLIIIGDESLLASAKNIKILLSNISIFDTIYLEDILL